MVNSERLELAARVSLEEAKRRQSDMAKLRSLLFHYETGQCYITVMVVFLCDFGSDRLTCQRESELKRSSLALTASITRRRGVVA